MYRWWGEPLPQCRKLRTPCSVALPVHSVVWSRVSGTRSVDFTDEQQGHLHSGISYLLNVTLALTTLSVVCTIPVWSLYNLTCTENILTQFENLFTSKKIVSHFIIF